MMHIIPGSPFAGETSRLPASVRETLIKGYGLDQPLTTQFATYLENVLHGDFGTSLNRKGKEVVDIIADGLPATASLGWWRFAWRCRSACFGHGGGVLEAEVGQRRGGVPVHVRRQRAELPAGA